MTLTYSDLTLKFTLDDGTSKVYKINNPESLENQLLKYIAVLDDPTTSDIASSDLLEARLKEIEDKLVDLTRTNVIEQTATAGTPVNLNNTSADYNVSGEIDQASNIKCKSLELSDSSIEASRLTVKASGEVDVKNLTISGEFNTQERENILNVDDSLYVNIDGVKTEAEGQYNGIYISHDSRTTLQPKAVTITNCELKNFHHHPIVVDSVQGGTLITVSDCDFEGCYEENFRWSNSKNVGDVIINFSNCNFSTQNANEASEPYCGFIILHDIVSAAGKSAENNLFAPEKLTINFVGCKYNGKILTKDDLVMGSKKPDQLIYVYSSKDGFIDYDESRYPKVTIIS